MIWEDFYVLGGGRYVRYSHGAMMRLRHELVIRQFYIDGGREIGFLEIVNRSRQWPGVGRNPLSMAASLCLELSRGGNKLLE